ncbi:MAG: FecR domain-containing protein [Candidatus Pseudobacter hemicellulosilyticus]|uniref:FecR domain-containing protein n=1 Tax=Candidatus Pseudobacter hemicellulosilyticus TaxID=3121375 RepID=A0AAJ6BFE5_9BACT|nr:MAG: FecR domain-containing protein [Pseudobacter sp.]
MHNVDPELLRRYHAGQCSPEEIKMIRDWLEREDNFFTEHKPQFPANTVLEQEIWHGLQQRMGVKSHNSPARVRSLSVSLVAAACITALVVGFGIFLLLRQPANKHEQQLASTLRKLTTPKGSRSRIILPDSSIVHVMGGSTIQYPATFTGPTRDLILEQGEVFLEIARNPSKPFIVQSGNAHIKVLGTRFNIANDSTSLMHVALTEGSIQFTGADNKSRILQPGEILQYDKSIGQISSISTFSDANEIAGWTKGLLRFNNAPLQDVFKRLSTYYGVNFILDTRINQHAPLTATIDNLPLSRVLSMMEYSTGNHFSLTNSTVIVKTP